MAKGDAARSDSAETRDLKLAQAIREACVQAALDGYEQAGINGLCPDGRWELAVDSMRSIDLDAIVQQPRPGAEKTQV